MCYALPTDGAPLLAEEPLPAERSVGFRGLLEPIYRGLLGPIYKSERACVCRLLLSASLCGSGLRVGPHAPGGGPLGAAFGPGWPGKRALHGFQLDAIAGCDFASQDSGRSFSGGIFSTAFASAASFFLSTNFGGGGTQARRCWPTCS